ncbi:MAG: hypothetical protein PUC37_06550 [Spirochaetales bacterium]|nr:hypothetical protein [Spirochaetales bacterium]
MSYLIYASIRNYSNVIYINTEKRLVVAEEIHSVLCGVFFRFKYAGNI